ncbi:MAG: YhjD/YihY/BrkB family envelope integrity protein [Candidatus Methylomirabilis sp.]
MNRPSLDAKGMATLFRRPHEIAAHILWKFWRDECPQRAASLAYTTLLSLVPSLAVAFAMLKAFGGLAPIQERLETLVYTHLVTTSSLQAADYIQRFTERVHAGAIGTVGFLAFIITAVSLLNTVAGAFNRVWGVEDRRSVKDRFLTFFALTILGPVLFGASISITGNIRQSMVWTWMPIPGLGPALGLVVPFLLTWAGFLLLYEVIPSAPLHLRPALFGSLAVAGTWELVKIGFEWYVSAVVNYGKVYASLSVIPVFLLWLYVSWLIALLGFEVSYFLQHPEACRGSVSPKATHATVPIPEAIRAFVAVAKAFVKDGGPVTGAQVAQRVLIPEGIALAALAELERQGYVARVAEPVGAYLPRRAPASVRVAELWQALGGRVGASGGDPLDQLLSGAADASARALGSTTVQDLFEGRPAWAAGETPEPAREDLKELA